MRNIIYRKKSINEAVILILHKFINNIPNKNLIKLLFYTPLAYHKRPKFIGIEKCVLSQFLLELTFITLLLLVLILVISVPPL